VTGSRVSTGELDGRSTDNTGIGVVSTIGPESAAVSDRAIETDETGCFVCDNSRLAAVEKSPTFRTTAKQVKSAPAVPSSERMDLAAITILTPWPMEPSKLSLVTAMARARQWLGCFVPEHRNCSALRTHQTSAARFFFVVVIAYRRVFLRISFIARRDAPLPRGVHNLRAARVSLSRSGTLGLDAVERIKRIRSELRKTSASIHCNSSAATRVAKRFAQSSVEVATQAVQFCHGLNCKLSFWQG
jgi:hypothetical protein